MTPTGLDGLATLERTLELIGLFAFAVSGGLLAVRKGFEVVGLTSLAVVTATGGGILRDIILGDTPPTAFRDVWYFAITLTAAAIVFVAHTPIERHLRAPVLAFDAIGLGLFAVTGAAKAVESDSTAIGAVALGVITAIGGGILRDVLANDTPQIFRPESRLYAIPATAGAITIVVLSRNGWYSGVAAAVVAAAVCAIRLASLRWGWRAPVPVQPRPADDTDVQAVRARKFRSRS